NIWFFFGLQRRDKVTSMEANGVCYSG
ncbi:hypothetical protein MGO_05496, partial [Candida albicans P76055]